MPSPNELNAAARNATDVDSYTLTTATSRVSHQTNPINPIHKHRSTRQRQRVLSQPAMSEGGSGGYVVLMICVPRMSLMTTWVCDACIVHARASLHDHARNAHPQRQWLASCQRRRWGRRRPCPEWAVSSSGSGSCCSHRAVSSRGPGVGLLRAGGGGACVFLCFVYVCGVGREDAAIPVCFAVVTAVEKGPGGPLLW